MRASRRSGCPARAAAQPEQRRGALLLNPGGPGADGLPTILVLHQVFTHEINSAHQQAALQLRLLDEYNMVGFSPRGTGASTHVQCATNELARLEGCVVMWIKP